MDLVYPESVQSARETLAAELQDACAIRRIDPYWLALKLLEGDALAASCVPLTQASHEKIVAMRRGSSMS